MWSHRAASDPPVGDDSERAQLTADRWVRRTADVSTRRALRSTTRASIYEHLRRVGEGQTVRDIAGAFETAPTEFREREVAPGLWAMTMDTDASLKEYLRLQLKVPLLARLGPLARADIATLESFRTPGPSGSNLHASRHRPMRAMWSPPCMHPRQGEPTLSRHVRRET